jgi:hypothetical protein
MVARSFPIPSCPDGLNPHEELLVARNCCIFLRADSDNCNLGDAKDLDECWELRSEESAGDVEEE